MKGAWTKNPKLRERILRFQRTFIVYFPDLADSEIAAFEWEWLHTRVVLNPKETVRPTQAKAELQKLAKALRVLVQHDMPYYFPLGDLLREAIEDAKKSRDKELQEIVEWEDHIFTFILELDELREDDKPHLASVIDKFVLDAEMAIDCLPETANVNWDAVHAVDGLRWLWWRNKGRQHAPRKALNPASTFANFLRDGFGFLEIDADPLSAFKRWSATTPEREK